MKNTLYILLLAAAGTLGLQWCFCARRPEPEPALRMVRQCITGEFSATNWKMLRALGPEALPCLREALTEKGSVVSQAYARLVAMFPEWLQNRLPSGEPVEMTRANAAAAAGVLGPAAASLVPELVALLKDEVAYGNAEWALAQMGPAAQAAIPALVTALEEERPGAASALGSFGHSATLALPALEHAAQKGPLWLRLEAGRALQSIRKMATPAKEAPLMFS